MLTIGVYILYDHAVGYFERETDRTVSSLSWIDFDDVERKRARRLIGMFAEKSTRDELGLGPIRDSIADLLFPGTNTLHTRLRYVFFVPWIYQSVEERTGKPDSHSLTSAGRRLEIELIHSLRRGGESSGVIGSSAGSSLQRLPSELYWSALRSWGICRYQGSQHDYIAALPSLRRERRRVDSSNTAYSPRILDLVTWHQGLPKQPSDLLGQVDFRLTPEEAEFLVDRIVNSHPQSLLAHLARNRRRVECDHIWEHPDRAGFPRRTERLVVHAKVFSGVMLGATLLYNLMLAQERGWEEMIQRYLDRISEWNQHLDLERVRAWSRADFWECVHHDSHRIRNPTRRFVTLWLSLVLEHQGDIAEVGVARKLVRQRETRLKGPHSRFKNPSALDRWRGASGTSRLSFRWAQMQSHMGDLADAE